MSVQGSWAVDHFITVTAQVGEHSWLTKTDPIDVGSSLGVGGAVGVNYELQQKHFLFTVGLAASPSYSVFSPDDSSVSFETPDSQGDEMVYSYFFKDRSDAYTNLSVQVPLMVGAQFGWFYFLAGAKFDMSVMARSRAAALVSSQGLYSKYIGVFHDMDEHAFFTNYEVETKRSFTFNVNALASVELGVRLGNSYKVRGFGAKKKQKVQYRLAVYADYGFLNALSDMRPFCTYPTVFNEQDMKSGLQITDLLHSEVCSKVNPLQVGVKFTVLFKVGDPKKCVICKDN